MNLHVMGDRMSNLSRIEAIGIYLPETPVATADLMNRIDPELRFDLERITGIRERRVYSRTEGLVEDSLTMAVSAVNNCLTSSRYMAEDLDIVIATSITRTTDADKFCFEPALALYIRNAVGAWDASYFDVTNACAGMITGLLILDRMVKAGAIRRGIVVSGEQITPIAETAVAEISQRYDPHFAALTVGDAAAAVLVDDQGQPGDCIEFIDMLTSAEYAELCIGMPSEQNPGVAMYTDNRSMQDPDRYLQSISRLRDFLSDRGSSFDAEQFDFIVHHQFSGPAIDAINALITHEFGSTQPRNLTVLEDLGNTASTSHFIVLHRYLSQGIITPGSKVLLVPAASGIVMGTVSATLTNVGV